MDTLRAHILLLHAKVERERLRQRVAFLESRSMTPNLKGAAEALAKLRHSLDVQASKLTERVEAMAQHGDQAFMQAHAVLDESQAALKEVDEFVSSLRGDNGGPILDGSAKPSGQ